MSETPNHKISGKGFWKIGPGVWEKVDRRHLQLQTSGKEKSTSKQHFPRWGIHPGVQKQNAWFEIVEMSAQAGGRSFTGSSLIPRCRGGWTERGLTSVTVVGSRSGGGRRERTLHWQQHSQLPASLDGEREAEEPSPACVYTCTGLPATGRAFSAPLSMALALLPENWSRKNCLQKWVIKKWTSSGSSQT